MVEAGFERHSIGGESEVVQIAERLSRVPRRARVSNRTQAPRIVASAEAFGQGPFGAMATLAKQVRQRLPLATIHAVTPGSLARVGQNNLALFDSVSNSPPDPREVDVAVSVMSPDLVLWGRASGVHTTYVDNLLHAFAPFDTSEFDRDHDRLAALSGEGSLGDMRRIAASTNPFNQHWLAHRVAQLGGLSLSTFFPPLHRPASAIDPHSQTLGSIQVLPIVASSARPAGWGPGARDTLLMNIGGMFSPLLPTLELGLQYIELNLHLASDLLRRALDSSPELSVTLTVHPDVVELSKKLPPITQFLRDYGDRFRVVALPHDQMLEALCRARLCLSTVGIGTLADAVASGTPIAFLSDFGPHTDSHVATYVQLIRADMVEQHEGYAGSEEEVARYVASHSGPGELAFPGALQGLFKPIGEESSTRIAAPLTNLPIERLDLLELMAARQQALLTPDAELPQAADVIVEQWLS